MHPSDKMSFIKQTPVSGVIAFGPRSLLAVGTAAGSINHDFSNDAQLEVSVCQLCEWAETFPEALYLLCLRMLSMGAGMHILHTPVERT